MFLVFTLVLLVVALGIMASVYSVFFPFMQNLGTVNQYYVAYYGAISSVERAELGLKYKNPGFVGSGGFLGTTGYGPISDYTPELLSGVQQGFWWMIDSRTQSIPHAGMGNTDPMLSDFSSKEYNALGYANLEIFLLSYDATSDPNLYYTYTGSSPAIFFSGGLITGNFRLPPKILRTFGGSPAGFLCDSYVGDCDPNGDGIYNDAQVSWSMEGYYQGEYFKIFPSISVFYFSGMQIDEAMDNAIRESIINDTGSIAFGNTNSFTPIRNGYDIRKHTAVGANSEDMQDLPFSTILTDSNDFSGLRLTFGAVNLFRTFTGAIYPYIEYQFTFPQAIADRFYTIQGHGRAGDYDVQIVITKPTIQGTVGGEFTIIF